MWFQRTFPHAANYLPWGSRPSRIEADFMLIETGGEYLLSQMAFTHERVLASGADIIPYIRQHVQAFDTIKVRK